MNIAIITPGAPPARKILPQAFYEQISGSSQYGDSLFSLLIHAGRPPLPWHSLSSLFILLTHVPLYRRSTLGGDMKWGLILHSLIPHKLKPHSCPSSRLSTPVAKGCPCVLR